MHIFAVLVAWIIYFFAFLDLVLNKREEELMKEIEQMDDAEKIMELPISYKQGDRKRAYGVSPQLHKNLN